MDIESRRNEVLTAYQQGSEAVVELVSRLVAELTAQWESLAVRVVALEAENAALRARVGTDSHNSSKPPSSDGPEVKPHPKSLRERTGRKPGGQPGHAGHTLHLVDDPDEVQVHAPGQCRVCGQSLERTGEVLAELFGCPLSERTLERAVAVCHEQLSGVEAAIKQGVTAAPIAHFDETGLNVGGKLSWLHVEGTSGLTFYGVHPKRGREAMEAMGVLAQFRGRAMHDGLASYWQYQQCEHALCNAHHLRELTFVEEQLGQPWAKTLKEVLVEIKRAVDQARACGLEHLPTEVKREFERRYDAALAEGVKANPPRVPAGQRGRPKREAWRNACSSAREQLSHSWRTLRSRSITTRPSETSA